MSRYALIERAQRNVASFSRSTLFTSRRLPLACFSIGGLHKLDFAAVRSKVETSTSLEDLRSRSLHAIAALESGDKALGRLHEIAFRLVRVGITWAVVNSILIYLLLRRVRHNDVRT